MVATVYPDSSPLALALPQVGHAALAAVQVTPGLGTRMGMPNRATAGLWGNGRFLFGPEVGPGPDCCSGAPGLGNAPAQRGPGKAMGNVSLLFFTLTFPPPGRTHSPDCVQAPGLGSRRERLSHGFPPPGRTRSPGHAQAPGLGIRRECLSHGFPPPGRTRSPGHAQAPGLGTRRERLSHGFPPPGRTRSPGHAQAPGLGNLSPFKGTRRERLSHGFPPPGRTRSPGHAQAPGLGTRRGRLSHSFPPPGRTRSPGCVQAPGLGNLSPSKGACPRSRGPVGDD
jgi:hypothetical protein